MEKQNNYKTLGDLANYLNEQPQFQKKWISKEGICKVFEKAHLFKYNEDEERWEPTDFMRNSNACFLTKSGKILFTEEGFNYMTKNTEQYKKSDWVKWFCKVMTSKSKEPTPEIGFNIVTNEKLPIYQYWVIFLDGSVHLFNGCSKYHVITKIREKYPTVYNVLKIRKTKVKVNLK